MPRAELAFRQHGFHVITASTLFVTTPEMSAWLCCARAHRPAKPGASRRVRTGTTTPPFASHNNLSAAARPLPRRAPVLFAGLGARCGRSRHRTPTTGATRRRAAEADPYRQTSNSGAAKGSSRAYNHGKANRPVRMPIRLTEWRLQHRSHPSRGLWQPAWSHASHTSQVRTAYHRASLLSGVTRPAILAY